MIRSLPLSASLCGVVTLGLFGSSCAVGPDYAVPEVDAPSSWDLELAEGLETDAAPVSQWWQLFADPTLLRIVELAGTQNHDLAIAASRIREARFERGIVAGDYGPTVGASGLYERSERSQNSFQGFISGERDLWSTGFDATWELDVFGRVQRGVEAADAEIGGAVEDYRDVRVSLVAEVARNFVELRSLQRRLEIAQVNTEAQRDTLALTRSRFEAGLTAELDVAQARVNLATTQSRIPPLEAAIVAAQGRLGILAGMTAAELDRALDGALDGALRSGDARVPVAPARIAIGVPAELIRRRPDVRRAERNVAAASARVGIATAELYPKFALTGSIGLEAEKFDQWMESDSRRFAYGPSIQWNLFASGRLRSAIRAAEERQLQTIEAYELAVLQAFDDARNALSAFGREQERVLVLREGEDAARSAVELAQSLYVQGISDFQNVLDAQRSLYELQDQLATSEADVTTNAIAIFKALGGGWESEG